MTVRSAILSYLELLSAPSKQLEYEKSVPSVNVHGKLIAGFCSDLYHPKSPDFIAAFSEDELRDLGHMYGLLMESGRVRASTVHELL